MNSLIEKYLRETGIEMITWTKNGCIVKVSEQEKLIHTLLSSYIKIQIDKNYEFFWLFSCV